MLTGIFANLRIEAVCEFAVRGTRWTLLADDTEMESTLRDAASKRAALEEQLGLIAVGDAEQQERVKAGLAEFDKQIELLRAKNADHRATARRVRFGMTGYGYGERITVREQKTIRDPETGERWIPEEIVVAALLQQHVVDVAEWNESTRTWGEPQILSCDEVALLQGPVANRLWRILREECEPTEDTLF